MVFKTASIGYPQINTMFHLKWLLMGKNDDFLINYIEIDPVQHCGICMPFTNGRHFPYDRHIPCTYIDSIAVIQQSIKKGEEEKYKL